MVRRRELLKLGRHGDRVRVKVDARIERVVVYYRDHDGRPRTLKYPDTREGRQEALAWAEGWFEERKRLATPTTGVTLRSLWTAYARARFPLLRSATQVNYRQRFDRWELYLGKEHDPNTTTLGDIERYLGDSIKAGRAVNQVRQILNVARVVYGWGQRMKIITTNEFAIYRWQKPKDAVVVEPEEYTAAEYRALMRGLSPQHDEQWRLWCVLTLAGRHGQRANAVLHLRDEDIVDGDIVWPARYQKSGVDVRQPLSDEALSVLLTSRYWRDRIAIASAYVIPSWRKADDAPYTYQGMYKSFRKLQTKAGVTWKRHRALHGLRRMVVGDVIQATGDRMLGLEYVGDRDPKVLRSYDKRAAERVRRASQSLDERRTEPGETRTESVTETVPKVSLVEVSETRPETNVNHIKDLHDANTEPQVGIEPTTA